MERVETHPSVSSALVSDPHLETIDVNRADGVVTITLNRPEKKNAINGPMWDELLDTFREIGHRRSRTASS